MPGIREPRQTLAQQRAVFSSIEEEPLTNGIREGERFAPRGSDTPGYDFTFRLTYTSTHRSAHALTQRLLIIGDLGTPWRGSRPRADNDCGLQYHGKDV
jgi:hypothetical protein